MKKLRPSRDTISFTQLGFPDEWIAPAEDQEREARELLISIDEALYKLPGNLFLIGQMVRSGATIRQIAEKIDRPVRQTWMLVKVVKRRLWESLGLGELDE